MHILINGSPIPVIGSPGLSPELLAAAVASPKFVDWADSVDPSLVVSSVEIQSVDLFGKNVGFLKLKASVTKDGKFVPGICFVRGDSVAMLVILECNGRLFSPLVVQPRMNMGSAMFEETAAGMVDGSSFVGAAAKEIKEELGFDIPVTDLVNLRLAACDTEESVALSPGGCDEEMRFYAHQRSVTPAELVELQGKLTGELSEGEMITLKIVPLEYLWKVNDAKTILAIAFYKRAVALCNIFFPNV